MPKSRSNGSSCYACGEKNDGLTSFFQIPKDSRRSIWLSRLRIDSINVSEPKICSNHFKLSQFHTDKKLRLKKTALPKIYEPEQLKPDCALNLNPTTIYQLNSFLPIINKSCSINSDNHSTRNTTPIRVIQPHPTLPITRNDLETTKTKCLPIMPNPGSQILPDQRTRAYIPKIQPSFLENCISAPPVVQHTPNIRPKVCDGNCLNKISLLEKKLKLTEARLDLICKWVQEKFYHDLFLHKTFPTLDDESHEISSDSSKIITNSSNSKPSSSSGTVSRKFADTLDYTKSKINETSVTNDIKFKIDDDFVIASDVPNKQSESIQYDQNNKEEIDKEALVDCKIEIEEGFEDFGGIRLVNINEIIENNDASDYDDPVFHECLKCENLFNSAEFSIHDCENRASSIFKLSLSDPPPPN